MDMDEYYQKWAEGADEHLNNLLTATYARGERAGLEKAMKAQCPYCRHGAPLISSSITGGAIHYENGTHRQCRAELIQLAAGVMEWDGSRLVLTESALATEEGNG